MKRSIGALVLLLAACSGGKLLPAPPPTTLAANALATGSGEATLVVHVEIPKKHHCRGDWPACVSASTKGMTVAFKGPSSLKASFDVDVSSPLLPQGCKHIIDGFECTQDVLLKSCPSKANCYKGSITTFDAVSCRQSSCTIPSRAHELSANDNIGFSVGSGRSTLQFTLDGIPASVALMPMPPSLLIENSPSSFTISKCVTTPQTVSVIGVDADGNEIIGPGAPNSPTLNSNDRTHLAVAKSSRKTFELVPPATLQSATIPNAGAVVTLTASLTPLKGSGDSKPVKSHIGVAFDGTICGVITQFPVPTSHSFTLGITTGPDRALWFVEAFGNKVGRITTGGTISETVVPGSSPMPETIAAGPDGALWFTEAGGNGIGRITTKGTITNQYTVPTSSSAPTGITAGPDGALWFTENAGNKIGRITTAGVFSESSIPTMNSAPTIITAGPDGALWFTECKGNNIGRITTGGSVSEMPVPAPSSAPIGIVTGPDNALWFAESSGNTIARMATGGGLTSAFPLPTAGSQPTGIVAGPDDALWFTELQRNSIGRISTGGSISEIPIPTASANPALITVGPDGALWFTEIFGNDIGRLQ